MNYKEMKIKTLALIEELNPNSELLTDDPDISAKFDEVTNQVMFELARIKKIPRYVEIEVNEGDTLEFADISDELEAEVYQISNMGGVAHLTKANNTVFKILEDGTAEIDCFVYPKRITANTIAEKYTFELTPDVLEIMPYGIAADLLKSDVSAEYGSVYATRYETMLQRLDPRYATSSIYIDGGINI